MSLRSARHSLFQGVLGGTVVRTPQMPPMPVRPCPFRPPVVVCRAKGFSSSYESKQRHGQPRLPWCRPAVAQPRGLVAVFAAGGSDGGAGGGAGGNGGGGGEGDGGSHGGNNRGGAAFVLLLASAFALLPVAAKKFADLIAAIPTPVLTPFLMAIASLLAAILTVWNQRVLSEQGRKDAASEAAKRRREQDLAVRRRMFQRYAEPLGQAAGGLQSKLFKMHEGTMPDRGQEGVEFTAYELGSFLGLLHVLRELSPSLSFGNPGRDAIRRNLLQDIEDALAWDLPELMKVSTFIPRELAWRNANPEDAIGDYDPGTVISDVQESSDILHIPRSCQRAIGDLMLRKRWAGMATCFGQVSDSEDTTETSTATAELITFADFQGLLRTNPHFRAKWQPILSDIDRIMPKGECNDLGKPCVSKAARDCPRVRILQAMLLDLMDFVDPKPFCRVVSNVDRKSILARVSSQDNPPFMRRLSLANEMDRLKLHFGEAYGSQVGSSYDETRAALESWQGGFHRMMRRRKGLPEWQVESDSDQIPQVLVRMGENGQPSLDPFSQRVVATLEHREIPYSVVPVSLNAKPRWLHHVSRSPQVPVMFHEGSILNTSDLILQYINFTWPHKIKEQSKPHNFPTTFLTQTLGLFRASDWVEFDLKKRQVFQSLHMAERAVEQAGSGYLAGQALGDADLALAPMLHQTMFILESHFGEDLSEFGTLKAYRSRCLSNPCLRATVPSDDSLQKAFAEHCKQVARDEKKM
mmetsp:Transcript_3428/g.9850  ORF Transcript_3428/g.9850 Transcript_3428/m.9850 type:complete len:751 (-) Transcript_3428:231-2483(-)